MMRLCHRIATLSALLVAAVAGPARAGDVSIMPSNFSLSAAPGEDATTVVHIHYGKDGPEDVSPLRIVLSTEDWDMSEDGSLSFEKERELAASARPWILFSPSEAEVRPGETLVMRVSVLVPDDAEAGEYRAALIAQPRAATGHLAAGTKRLDLQCRLASIVYVTVPPVHRNVDLAGLSVARKDDRWVLQPRIQNLGQTTLRVHDSFEILPLGAAPSTLTCERDLQESGVVLPGRMRELSQWLPCDLPEGTYSLLYRADVGSDLPLLEGETSFTVPGDGREPALAARGGDDS